MFGCKIRWIYSIGYAVRDDVKYPDITSFGSNEAERRFNYFSSKYGKIKEFMSNFTLIENQYGPGSTWVSVHVSYSIMKYIAHISHPFRLSANSLRTKLRLFRGQAG